MKKSLLSAVTEPLHPPYLFPVRLVPTPAQQALFAQAWQRARLADRYAWLIIQSVLQLQDLPTLEALRQAARDDQLLPGLVHPDPDQLHATPAALQRLRRNLPKIDLKVVEQLVRRTLGDPVPSLPYGVVGGAVRRMYAPLMHTKGRPDEVRQGDLPSPRTLADAPALTFNSVQVLSGCEVLLRGADTSQVVAAELFTLPRVWREAVLSAQIGQGFAPIPRVVAQQVDGGWRLWLVMGRELCRQVLPSPLPTLGQVGVDPGEVRWLTAYDINGEVPLPHVPREYAARNDSIQERQRAFAAIEPLLDEAYERLAPYAVVCWEGSGFPVHAEFIRYQARSFQRVLRDRLAADIWPRGRRAVLLTLRTGTTRRCPECGERLHIERELRWSLCHACGFSADRDLVAARNHFQQGFRLPLARAWRDLPGDLAADFRQW